LSSMSRTRRTDSLPRWDRPDQGIKAIPVTAVTRNGSSLTLELRLVGGTFHGTIDTELTTVTGTWTQDGMNQPFTLKRIKDASGRCRKCGHGEEAGRAGAQCRRRGAGGRGWASGPRISSLQPPGGSARIAWAGRKIFHCGAEGAPAARCWATGITPPSLLPITYAPFLTGASSTWSNSVDAGGSCAWPRDLVTRGPGRTRRRSVT